MREMPHWAGLTMIAVTSLTPAVRSIGALNKPPGPGPDKMPTIMITTNMGKHYIRDICNKYTVHTHQHLKENGEESTYSPTPEGEECLAKFMMLTFSHNYYYSNCLIWSLLFIHFTLHFTKITSARILYIIFCNVMYYINCWRFLRDKVLYNSIKTSVGFV